MKMMLLLTRLYFKTLSILWPSKAGEKAFYAFQRTRRLPFKKAEIKFYETARRFEVVHPNEKVNAYELGDPKGKLVLLVHGWESNAGSMGAIANRLSREGYRVVALDLPAHGKSALAHTNLHECREALRAVIYQLRPASFSIVSHSFGSAVSAFALADS
jgi:alpha-beta hydrolase superfamily lysophospholipase